MSRTRTILSRTHWALLLCRVMSAKSKSRRVARKSPQRESAQATEHRPARVPEKPSGHEADLFAHGVTLFNTRYFFEAHEAWEEIWLHTDPPEKTFLQGLIQITAAFHHQSRNNLRGTASLLRAGLIKLEDFPPHHRGLHIEKLRLAVRRWLAALAQAPQEKWPSLPRIALTPNHH